MPNNVEELAWSLPDGVVHERYLDPEFWLSGEYASFSTSTIRFVTLGHHVTRWVYEVNEHDPLNFASLMADTTGIGGPKTTDEWYNHILNGMPSNIFFLKGTTEWAMDLPRRNPKHLSNAAREEMGVFAGVYPNLLDALRFISLEDFKVSSSDRLLSSKELLLYRRMPGRRFIYWLKCFPTLLEKLYDDIRVDGQGEVQSYKVQPISDAFASYLGVPPDPFAVMEGSSVNPDDGGRHDGFEWSQ